MSMTREELKEHCEKQIKNCEKWATYNGEKPHGKIYEEHKLILELLEQETKTEQFAEWVASEIFDDNWQYNKDAFAELACRKLEKLGILGIVRVKGDEWELLVNPQEK